MAFGVSIGFCNERSGRGSGAAQRGKPVRVDLLLVSGGRVALLVSVAVLGVLVGWC